VPGAALPEITVPRRPDARSASPAAETSIRQALDAYAGAYSSLDVGATIDVWPTVDRQALARAFGTLRSQEVAFDSCRLEVATGTAVAHCRGTLQFVRRIGNPAPRAEAQQWTFRMRKLGDLWKIERVTASTSGGPPSRDDDNRP
jgi:hypothetical protein